MSGKSRRPRQVHAYGVAKPEPDMNKLAKALLELAREMRHQEQDAA